MKTAVPAATRANLERFLEGLPEYVVLRNHDIWLNLARGGDIDLLVADADEAEKALFSHLGIPLRIDRRSYGTDYWYPWGRIDISSRLEWRGIVYLSAQTVLEMAERSRTKFPRPRLAHEALVSWLQHLIAGGFFKERYKAVIFKAAQEDGAAFRQALIYAAGRVWGERLYQVATEGRPETSAKWARAVRRAAWWQTLRRAPLNALLRWLAHWKAEIGLRLRPPTPWVAVLGPDGSGKSSVLEALEPRLARIFRETQTFHWRPGFLRPAKGGGGPVTDPHGEPPRGVSTSLLKLVFLFWDWTLGYWGHLVHLQAKGDIILFDRDYYDCLADSKRYRHGGPLRLVEFVGRFIPRPDLVILLDAPPEVLQARKQEVPFEEIIRQRKQYLKLVRNLPGGHVVDASRPLDDVVDEAKNIILDYVAEQTARGLKLAERV